MPPPNAGSNTRLREHQVRLLDRQRSALGTVNARLAEETARRLSDDRAERPPREVMQGVADRVAHIEQVLVTRAYDVDIESSDPIRYQTVMATIPLRRDQFPALPVDIPMMEGTFGADPDCEDPDHYVGSVFVMQPDGIFRATDERELTSSCVVRRITGYNRATHTYTYTQLSHVPRAGDIFVANMETGEVEFYAETGSVGPTAPEDQPGEDGAGPVPWRPRENESGHPTVDETVPGHLLSWPNEQVTIIHDYVNEQLVVTRAYDVDIESSDPIRYQTVMATIALRRDQDEEDIDEDLRITRSLIDALNCWVDTTRSRAIEVPLDYLRLISPGPAPTAQPAQSPPEQHRHIRWFVGEADRSPNMGNNDDTVAEPPGRPKRVKRTRKQDPGTEPHIRTIRLPNPTRT